MTEKKKTIPKPTLKTSSPAPPPVTSVDTDAPPPSPAPVTATPPPTSDAPQEESVPAAIAKEDSQSEDREALDHGSEAVETDLMKRFLGIFIDALVASFIGFIVVSITGSDLLQWLAFSLVLLTRDSLPMLDGQSLGKKVMNTKAVKEDGSSLAGDWAVGATRNILFAIPFAPLVDCFIIFTRSGKPGAGLRLGDDWAKTKVISLE